MGIKVSDVMLDLATGDASMHDAYIQEAMGKIRVSAAIYDAASKIADLDDNERGDSVVQEAATAVGLPYDREGAIQVIYEAVQHELSGMVQQIYDQNSKLNDMYSKPTSPIKAVVALAKKNGVSGKMDYSRDYAGAVADAVVKNKGVSLEGKHFLKAKSARKRTEAYIRGVATMLNAYNVSMDTLFDDPTVSAVARQVKCKECKTLKCIESSLSAGGTLIKTAELSEEDYTDKITKNDLATVITCIFALYKTANFVNKSLSGNKGKAAQKFATDIVEGSKCKDKVCSAAEDLNDKTPDSDGNKKSNIENYSINLKDTATNLLKAFGDSIDSLVTSSD